jgi:hypothetical protein
MAPPVTRRKGNGRRHLDVAMIAVRSMLVIEWSGHHKKGRQRRAPREDGGMGWGGRRGGVIGRRGSRGNGTKSIMVDGWHKRDILGVSRG